MKKILFSIGIASLFLSSCSKTTTQVTQTIHPEKQPFVWNAANVYFLLTDRFENGDKKNDINYGRTAETAKLRGFEGGDFRGIINKIEIITFLT